tara:strand:- start:3764 stop:4099 length:336 start_codon:yes stop_codon:yes gene_type:complete
MPTPLNRKLRSHREAKGYSLDRLSDLTGISKSYLWELENRDNGNPSAEKLRKIAEVLDLTLDFLLNDESLEPNELVVKEAFYRKFDRLDADAKKKIGDILDMWSRKDDEST